MDVAAELRAAAAGALARELPSAWLEAHLVLPLGVDDDGAMRVAAGAAPDATVIDALARRFARPVRLVPVPPQDLRAAVLAAAREAPVAPGATDLLGSESTADVDDGRLRALADEAPVVTVVDALLRDALRLGASDVHLESAAEGVRVRFRLDGVLRDVERVAPSLRAGVVSRVKVLAGLDVAERRRPQDGRARVRVAGADGAPREVDLRVATLPALHGESVVLRVLDHGGGLGHDLDSLGMPEAVRARFERLLARTTGLVLVTGPTGSGKTTSLYAALARVATTGVKVVTVEDPVEYRMPGVVQVAVQPAVGLTFASALRAILRHDPDVVLVGEMRDRETAETAVQAALTGHLVFSTLHTTDAAGGVARLADMGVERFLIAATVQGILAQRLVRVLCDACAQPAEPDAARLATLVALAGDATDMESARWRRAVGCAACAHTGFRGRTGIYELLVVTETMRALVAAGAPQDALRAQARRDGLVPLAADGLRLARAGRTTLDEVLRVAHLDDAA